MGYSIFGRISDYRGDSGRVLFTPHDEGDNRLVPGEESEFDAAVVEAEIMAFDAEAAAIYRDAGLSRVEYGSDADVTYSVLPDGSAARGRAPGLPDAPEAAPPHSEGVGGARRGPPGQHTLTQSANRALPPGRARWRSPGSSISSARAVKREAYATKHCKSRATKR